MNIGIEHHNDQFNVTLTSPGGSEPFLTVKGCRIIQGQNGPFVSWPAKKMDSGKYWNHVYTSRAFGEAVVNAYNKSKAAAPRPASKPVASKPPVGFEDMDNNIPFIVNTLTTDIKPGKMRRLSRADY